jgi:hypothetical protein
MVPVYYSVELYRGDSFRMQVRLWADAGKTQPVDLTGASVAAEIRPAPGAIPAASFTCAITANVIDVSLSAADSLNVPQSAYWDLQITYASGDVQTVIAGGVSVRGEITQPAAARRVVAHV